DGLVPHAPPQELGLDHSVALRSEDLGGCHRSALSLCASPLDPWLVTKATGPLGRDKAQGPPAGFLSLCGPHRPLPLREPLAQGLDVHHPLAQRSCPSHAPPWGATRDADRFSQVGKGRRTPCALGDAAA